ncbi:MAG: 2-oxoglutarate dehydrogenase E1 component, partial [Gallionellaceae bacterium]
MNEKNYMQAMRESSLLFGMNDVFIEGLYEDYLVDPKSVANEWREYFDALKPGQNARPDVAHSPVQRAFEALPKQAMQTISPNAEFERKQVRVLQMINAHRFRGVRRADLDPLSRHTKPEVPELELAHYDLGQADLDTTFETGSLVGATRMTLREIMQLLRQVYCSSIGAEYMYINDVAQKRWVQNRLEGSRGQANYSAGMQLHILERLTAAETLERYLHTKYVGQKRFS